MGAERVGLALKTLSLSGDAAGVLAPYLVVYIGSEAMMREGRPLIASLRSLEPVTGAEPVEFEGFGVMALAPVEAGDLCIWRAELWASRWAAAWPEMAEQEMAFTQDLLGNLLGSLSMDHPLIGALAQGDAAGAMQHLCALAIMVGSERVAGGDRLLISRTGICRPEAFSATYRSSNAEVAVTWNLLITDEAATIQLPQLPEG